MPNVHDLIQRHSSLSITCLDRLYINGYVPTLQTSGQLCYFLKQHLGNPRLTVSEIAFLVGFSELSPFQRAFRRWTGLAPRAYRERAARARGAP